MKLPKNFWREAHAHKGSGGRLSVVAGSKGYAGAGLLCSEGALVAGCGYVRWCVPETLYEAVAGLFVDGIVTPLWDGGTGVFQSGSFESLVNLDSSAFVVGPGWGQGAGQLGFLRKLLSSNSKPLVLDADALNLLENSCEQLSVRHSPTVITPHPGEAARLLGCSTEGIQSDREKSVKELQRKTGAVVILKGPKTLVASEKDLWENDSGSANLATAGSGDVLSGLIGALIARGIDAFEAAKFSVHWHGLAGEHLKNLYGPQGVGARALISSLREVQKRWWDADSSNQ